MLVLVNSISTYNLNQGFREVYASYLSLAFIRYQTSRVHAHRKPSSETEYTLTFDSCLLSFETSSTFSFFLPIIYVGEGLDGLAGLSGGGDISCVLGSICTLFTIPV